LLTGNVSLIHKKAALVKRVLVRVPVKEYAKSNYQRGAVDYRVGAGYSKLSVSDQGRGFNPNKPSATSGINIRSMEERV